MRKKLFFILAMLLTAVTGAWAQIPNPNVYDDVWDGVTKTKPWDVQGNGVTIHTAAELAYITEHWGEASSVVEGELCRDLNFSLVANLDMSAANWTPMGEKGDHLGKRNDYFKGKFYGNSHTICIKIDRPDSDDDKLGLFKEINFGEVRDLHVTGKIEVGDAQEVGGICGTCEAGTIINCWVSADIKSSHYSSIEDAILGGIAGKIRNGNYVNEKSTMQFCCMTGNVENPKNSGVGGLAGVAYGCNISHCALYGIVSVDHDQDNKWIGIMSSSCTLENYYDSFNPDEYNAANGYDLYRYAIKYPYAINITTIGQGSVTVSADGEDNIPGARQHQEVTLTTTTGSTAEVTVTDADGNNLTLFGNSGASGYTFIMPQKNVNVHAIFTVPDWPRQGQGSGTADSPYLITSADDWNEFALSVNAGNNHSGKHVKLTKDISIWMMAGASVDCSFQGTFDGDGHTMTFNPTNTNAVTAPFRFTKNATIKNLRTAGSITTDAMSAAGIVGNVTGSLSLTNCCSAVTISSSRSDADFHGGLVASNNGSVTISGCVFDGSFVATVAHTNQYGTTFCGGLVGMSNVNTSTTITNSLVAPTSVSEGMVSNTFVGYSDGSSTLNITNSYFVATTNLPTNQGTQAHTISAGDDVTISDIGEATTTYGSDGITVYENGIKYRDTFFVVSGKTVSLTLSHGDKMGYHFSQYAASAGTISAQTETSATLTMPAANITISAEWTKFIDGTGTADDPYVIDNADDWNTFADYVNNGISLSGKFVKLTADIDISTMAGASDANSFQGTFDGDGHTLTFTKGTSAEPFAEEYCAPFRHVKNAVIKNLHVAGTIYTNQKKAAGIVGESHGALTLTGCISSVNIHSSVSGDGTHGGLVSTLSGSGNTITIDGCVFDGSFATTNGTINCGGFIGWVTYNKPTITNSLMAPASVSAGMVANTFSRWHTGYEPTITNCYYVATTNLPTDQGTEAIALDTAPANLGSLVENYGMVKAYQNGILVGGLYYVDRTMASFRLLSDATTGDVGKVVCAAGHLHPAKTVVPDGCTAVGILGKVTETGIGLILALQDATSQNWLTINGWTSVTAYAGTTLKQLPNDATRGSLTSYTTLGKTTVSNWCVAQKSDYEAIFINLGSTTGDSAGKTYDANVNAYITTGVGGMAIDGNYCSASVTNSNLCWAFESRYWFEGNKQYSRGIRPVLGFTFIASELPGTGTAGDPYTISNSDEWTNFAYNVNSGNNFSGKYVKLTSDISVTTPVGYRVSDSGNKPFSGTFLGDGHTITAALADDGNQGLAPFRYINGATIKDLKVAGAIASSQYHTSGLVGFADGTNLIENCIVTATLDISSDYAGGIVGHGRTSTTTIRGCAFAGTINGVDVERENIGGIWGWSSSGTPTLLNCLENGTYTNIASMHPMGLQNGSGTITNCYYMNPQVGSPQNACTVSGAKQAAVLNITPANPDYDYGMVKAYKNGIWFDGNFYGTPATISLANAEDNSTTISNANGYVANVTLTGRTLYKDGAWNTLCLPFAVSDFTGTPLQGAIVKELGNSGDCDTGFDSATGTLTLDFVDANMIEAGHAYIVMWTKPSGYDGHASDFDIRNPVFNGVTVVNENPADQKVVSQDGYVQFIGTYSPVDIYTAKKTNLYLGAGNTLYYPTETDFKVNAFRGYFQLKQGLTAGEPTNSQLAGVRAFVLNFGDDEATGIISIENGKLKIENDADAWYSLDGRKLSGKPSVKGVYVNNGRKVIIK